MTHPRSFPERCRILYRYLAFYLPLSVCGIDVARAADSINTDGPDFVDSSESVPRGTFQFESSVLFSRERDTRTVRSTPLLLHYGLTDSFELRLGTDGWLATAGSERRNEIAPLSVGFKWHSQDSDAAAAKPSISWIFEVGLPSGTGSARAVGVRPSLRSVITWDLSAGWSFGAMPGISRTLSEGGKSEGNKSEGGRPIYSGLFGLVLAKQIGENLHVFGESATSQIRSSANGGIASSWDGGAAWTIAHDWLLGFRASIAANRNAPSRALFVEFAGRF